MAMQSRASVTWRYLPERRVKHAMVLCNSVLGHAIVAVCGVAPAWFAPAYAWRGTGNQTEYEMIERLPECGRCKRLIGSTTERGSNVNDGASVVTTRAA